MIDATATVDCASNDRNPAGSLRVSPVEAAAQQPSRCDHQTRVAGSSSAVRRGREIKVRTNRKPGRHAYNGVAPSCDLAKRRPDCPLRPRRFSNTRAAIRDSQRRRPGLAAASQLALVLRRHGGHRRHIKHHLPDPQRWRRQSNPMMASGSSPAAVSCARMSSFITGEPSAG